MSALNRQITEAIRRPSPSALAASSIGFGGLALYLYLRSKTSTVGTDMLDILTFVKWKREIAKKTKGDWSVGDTWEERVASDPSKIALHFIDENKSYTFKEVNEKANQVAHWGLAEGLQQGDVVALMMENRPEFIFTWLGLIKIGVCLSLINTNLTGKPLIHSLSVCGATHAIIGGEYARSIVEVRDSVGDKITGKWFSVTGSIPGHVSLDSLLVSQPTTNPPRSVRNKTNSSSPMFYIYTSGTTGHPKASVIKHLRFFVVAMAFSEIYKVRKPDRVYCCLPLYHSAGGIVGVGFTVYSGCTFVFRRKFSASSFWKDICENNCTVFQYIGELCRYLLAQPETEYDSKHKVRVCIGNGMRPDVWQQFEKRFQVGQIGEFYGATEGNANMANSRGKYAAVGYISPLFAPLFPIKLVRFDIESEQPIRGKDGLCIPCRDGEVGELLGAIDYNDPLRSFDGYTDKEATNKKILRDVFTKGDAWFRTGDLLRKDSEGFFYFVDRIGDTFRWKGENVATGEIAEVVSAIAGVEEANIYGVTIPGFDGRAGMACIVIDKTQFNFDNFYTVTKAQLPSYAQPIFIRVQPAIEITSTFKHKKADLQKEGFNPSEITDDLYFRDTEKGAYVPLTNDLYNQIVSGQKSKL